MTDVWLLFLFLLTLLTGFSCKTIEKHPYLTTQTPITLLSFNDGEINQVFLKTVEQTTD